MNMGNYGGNQVSEQSFVNNKDSASFLDLDRWEQKWVNQGLGVLENGGSATGSNYIRINLDQTVANSELELISKASFKLPSRFGFAFSHSQKVLGQEFEYSFVSCNADGQIEIIPQHIDLAINGTVSVTANVATINFSTAHGLVGDDRVILVGNTDPRINIGPALVTVVTATQITIPTTLGNATYTAGGVVRVANFDKNALNSVGFCTETATVTNARWFTRRNGASVRHVNATIATSTGVQSTVNPFSDGWNAGGEHEFAIGFDQVNYNSKAPNALTAPSGSLRWSEALPDTEKRYKLRIRSKNLDNIARPIANITAIAKTGTTTATVTTDVAHGLSTDSWVQIYGVRDITNFPNLTATTQVASIVSPTEFTIIQGSAVTANSAGGSVILNNGGILAAGLGYQNLSVQSIVRTNNIMTITVNTTATGALPGEMFRLHGCDAAVAPLSIAAFGLDGAYKILRMTGSTYEVESTGPDFVSVNGGGNLFKSTCNRIHFVRKLEYPRDVIEIANQNGIVDAAKAMPVSITNSPAVTVSSGTITTVSAVTTAGTPAVPATPYSVNSLNTTNGALILTGTSGLQAFYASNIGATVAHVKLYNKATAPTVGTDVPLMVIPVPAAVGGVAGFVNLTPGFNGYRFPLGLGIAITGLMADSDTTAVAAGQIKVQLSRTA